MSKLRNHWREAIWRARSTAPAAAATTGGRRCDDEELAAFMDGRLGERERSKMMSHLADAGDAYEVFACATVMLSDSDALLERMQTAEVRAATRRAFDTSPDDLRKAAMKAARSSDG